MIAQSPMSLPRKGLSQEQLRLCIQLGDPEKGRLGGFQGRLRDLQEGVVDVLVVQAVDGEGKHEIKGKEYTHNVQRINGVIKIYN